MKQQINVMVDPKTLAEIDKYAAKMRISRSHLMRLFLTNGLEEAKEFEKRGFPGLVACDRATQARFIELSRKEVLPHGLS